MGRPHSRMDRMKSRGFGGNHDLFIPPDGWLDGAPSAAQILSIVHDEVSLEENEAINAALKQLATCAGQPVSESAYASYNQPPPGPPKQMSSDPTGGMRVVAAQPDWADYLGAFEGELTMPLYDETHYAIKEPVTNADTLKALLGQPVKAETQFGDSVGCLIAVEPDGTGTLFNAGDGYMGTSTFALSDAKSVGRAWYLE